MNLSNKTINLINEFCDDYDYAVKYIDENEIKLSRGAVHYAYINKDGSIFISTYSLSFDELEYFYLIAKSMIEDNE